MHRLTSLLCLTALALPLLARAEQPNMVIILADDMGWGDPRCYQPDSVIPTPHLDRMAAGGMRFTDAHTPSSVCTPTRYTLLTGRYCWRTRLKSSVLDGFSPPLIEDGRSTIASLLKAEGYQTACIGKWHLGMQWTRKDGSLEDVDRVGGFRSGENIDFTAPIQSGPLTAGFDHFHGISASLDMAPYCWIEDDQSEIPTVFQEEAKSEFLNQVPGLMHPDFALDEVLPILKEKTVAWIREHAADPFFLYLPLNSPHLPVTPSAAFLGKSDAGLYGDFLMETDDYVGAVLDVLEETGTSENTLVLFTSDNGGLWHAWEKAEADDLEGYNLTPRARYNLERGHRSNAHMRGTKADIYEGGHRVPFLIQWPGKVEAGTTSDELVELTDVYATVAEILEQPLEDAEAEDSFSFLPVLLGERESTRPWSIHHSLRGAFAIRQGSWKMMEQRGSGGFSHPRLVEPEAGEASGGLYHLGEDPSETQNQFLKHPEMVDRLQKLLDQTRDQASLRAVAGD